MICCNIHESSISLSDHSSLSLSLSLALKINALSAAAAAAAQYFDMFVLISWPTVNNVPSLRRKKNFLSWPRSAEKKFFCPFGDNLRHSKNLTIVFSLLFAIFD